MSYHEKELQTEDDIPYVTLKGPPRIRYAPLRAPPGYLYGILLGNHSRMLGTLRDLYTGIFGNSGGTL